MPDSDLKVRKRIYRMELGAYILIVSLAIFGFHQLQQQQDDTDRTQACTEEYLSATLRAVNERTTFSVDQVNANARLQQAQAKFLRVLLAPGENPEAGNDALVEYVNALAEFNTLSQKNAEKAQQFPYPDPADYRECLDS